MFRFDVVPAGDSALHVQLPERIDPLENAWCIRLARSIEQHLGSAVRDVVVGYCSVTAYFEPLLTDPAWLAEPFKTVKRWQEMKDYRVVSYECSEPKWLDELEGLYDRLVGGG